MLQKMRVRSCDILTWLVSSPSLNFQKVNSGPSTCMTSGPGPRIGTIQEIKSRSLSHSFDLIRFCHLFCKEMGLTSFQGSTHLPCHENIAVCGRHANPPNLEKLKGRDDWVTGWRPKILSISLEPQDCSKKTVEKWGVSHLYATKRYPKRETNSSSHLKSRLKTSHCKLRTVC